MDLSDLEELRNLTPVGVLRKLAQLEQRLTSPGSTSGIVAERARLGLAVRPTGYQGDGGAEQRLELTHLLGFVRDLNPAEREAARLRYGGVSGHVTYEALRRSGDLVHGDGEVVIDHRPTDLEGKPLGGEWVRVCGVKATLPSHAEIAREMARRGFVNGDGAPMSPGAVEKLLRTAGEKVGWALRARLAQAELEERASG